jgi:hypothetical protein
MARCLICNAKKGKRQCLIVNGMICSLCCGQTRKEETCSGCIFFHDPRLNRNYNKVPSYSTQDMEYDDQLTSYSNAIEGSLCAFDMDHHQQIKDSVAIKILELLIDKYHFSEQVEAFDNEWIKEGFEVADKVIETDLEGVPNDEIVKVLGVIRFVARRRSTGGREYMDVILRYIGPRIGPGVRIMARRLSENSDRSEGETD